MNRYVQKYLRLLKHHQKCLRDDQAVVAAVIKEPDYQLVALGRVGKEKERHS